jgi:peptide-methionine (S)-S-oxide reductase
MIKPALILSVMLLGLMMTAPARAADVKTFVYSGGCYWCTEADSEKLDGVSKVISGYESNREAAQVFYDPDVISYEDLVRHVYRTIDFEDDKGQFCDRGQSYSPAIYYKSEEEKAIAEALAPPTSVVPIEPERQFRPVRESRQNYYKTHSTKYKIYRFSCGRDKRLKELNG